MKSSVALLLALFCLAGLLPLKAQQFKAKEVYSSATLRITQLSENTFQHTSFLPTKEWGNVPCNGLIVRNGTAVVVFDTPTNDGDAQRLIAWLKEVLHVRVKAVIPTHFHDDCLGGLTVFHKANIPSYAYFKTIELAAKNHLPVPKHSFRDSLILQLGKARVIARYFGEGHTRDNVIGYFPAEGVMFGGCLIKEMGAGKGSIVDSNVKAWAHTVEKVRDQYPNVKIVVPGHGLYGDKKLFDYTIKLFGNE